MSKKEVGKSKEEDGGRMSKVPDRGCLWCALDEACTQLMGLSEDEMESFEKCSEHEEEG